MPFLTASRRLLLVGALAAGGPALAAGQADAAYTPTLQDRTLVVTGDAASDTLALRVSTTNKAAPLELDVGDDGTADVTIARTRLDRIRVLAGDGADNVRVVPGAIALPPTTIEGQGGNDTLLGGNAAETLSGGDGDDLVDGGQGDDAIDLGAGNDSARWGAGDGNDTVDGGAGFDTQAVAGSGADEQLQLAANGARARLTRSVGTVSLDLGETERVDIDTFGGADTLTIDDLTGTGVQEVRPDLEFVAGGNTPDTATDRIILNGTAKDDFVSVLGGGAQALFVLGLPTFVSIAHGDPARDKLTVTTLAGNDRIEAGSVNSLELTEDGGAGDDTLTGSDRADTIVGGDGNDFADGQRGDDVALLGAGDDTFDWRPGDGGDRVEGQLGKDSLVVSGSAANEQFQASASGARMRFARTLNGTTDTVDTGGIERLSVFSFGGADTVVVNDTAGSDLTNVEASLFDFGVPGGAQDVVVVNGSAGADTLTAVSDANSVNVTGVAANVRVTGSETSDRLEVNGLGGDDTIDSRSLAPAKLQLRADGGAGNDVMLGGAGDDVLSGGDGADVIHAGGGDNVAFGGAGDDILRGEEGDDFLDGGAGDDILIGNAGDDILLNGEVVFDD
jgi:Ca2+-binding RTX toxin-like protein